MTRIGLLSDTHDYLDPAIFEHFKGCDEVWHAGDFGSYNLVSRILEGFGGRIDNTCQTPVLPEGESIKRQVIFRGVYGNIDGRDIRADFPEKLHFTCEKVTVFMQHIGGYPSRYAPGVKKEIAENHARLFISGHSHILKVIYDDKLQCLHMNPGAAGKQGWQKVRTIIRFVIDGYDMKDCEVIEL